MATETATGPYTRAVPTHIQTLIERTRRFEDDADPFLRGLIATRVYRDEPGLPVVRRRAEVLARTLEQIEPIVLPEELILGATYHRHRVHAGVGEHDAWRIQVLHPERRGFDGSWPMPDGVREELRWWKARAVSFGGRGEARRRYAWLGRYAVASPHGGVNGHTLPDHGILLDAGISGLRQRIAHRLQTVETDAQRDELLAMDRCLEGLSRHCLNCAAAAERRSAGLDDAALAERLRDAAARCRRLATDAPATFDEALQLVYFSNFADHMDTPGDATSFGRLDQLLAPFYESDLAAGRLSRDGAFELVCSFLCKKWALQDSVNITLGGVTPDGTDAVNELSFLFLEAMEATELVTDISVRLHDGTPDDFYRTVMRVVRRSFGRPSLFNDEVTIPALVAKGIHIEDARDYAPLGCVEVMIPGRTACRTMCMGLNLPKVLELVLNEGRCLVTGDRVWDDVPGDFADWDALLEHYHGRVRQACRAGMEIIREDELIEPTIYPRPWLTLLSRGGIEDAVDMTAGQPKYDMVGVTLCGLADIANSLYAVCRLLYEEGRLSLAELRDILRVNWDGHEDLRQFVINRLPRFGQDDPDVDAIAAEEAAHYAACFEGEKTAYGGPFCPMIFGVATSLTAYKAPRTGATPSGRRAGDPLSMSLQPSTNGPQGTATAVLHSSCAVDGRLFAGGISNVQECDPVLVGGEGGLERLGDLVRGFLDSGGMELSLNFLDEDTLRAAQADPERYCNLTVRLFGMSAHFIDLSPELQEEIIQRVAAAGRRAG